jgi:hypothetical protein
MKRRSCVGCLTRFVPQRSNHHLCPRCSEWNRLGQALARFTAYMSVSDATLQRTANRLRALEDAVNELEGAS